LALGLDSDNDKLDEDVSSFNQGDDAALGAMYGEDSENQVGENGANAEDGAQDAVEEGRSANAAAAAAAP
jgi:hypothetical protein